MVASIKPHRDELGLADGRMLINGHWVAASGEATWSHRHPATGEEVAAFPVAGPADCVLNVITGPGEPTGQALISHSMLDKLSFTGSRTVGRKVMEAGTVGVNGFQLEPNWPFGGYRQSGLGREGGRAAIESYTELKTVLLPFTGEMM